MANISIRIDENLKARSYEALHKLGVTPSELLRQALEYVAEHEQLPFRAAVVNEEDIRLLNTVKKRLAHPKEGIKVNINDL